MADNEPVKNRRPALGDVAPQPAGVHLRRPIERRDIARRKELTWRVYSEFLEMPGMMLSPAQATRLFNIPSEACARIFQELIDDGVLRVFGSGRYGLCQRYFPE
jgi:hypothetical protein